MRPTEDDPGLGGVDPRGAPLSLAQQLSDGRLVDRFARGLVDPARFEADPGRPVRRGERTAVRGAFKTPGLRNVEHTAPYMHNGGMLTLEQVVEFYARGGDFPRTNQRDLDPGIRRIEALAGRPRRIAAVASFLRSLTDPRVVDESAPFDHPSIVVREGVLGHARATRPQERRRRVPAVGRRGRRAQGLPPIVPFLGAPDGSAVVSER